MFNKYLDMQSFKDYFYDVLSENNDLQRNIIDSPFGTETIEKFIERHRLDFNGTHIKMYHASPKKTKFINNMLKEWSKFEKTPEKARFFAARDRDLDEHDINVFSVLLLPGEIEWTGFVQNNKPIPLDRIELIKDNGV